MKAKQCYYCGMFLSKILHTNDEGKPICTTCYMDSGQMQKDAEAIQQRHKSDKVIDIPKSDYYLEDGNLANGVDIDE